MASARGGRRGGLVFDVVQRLLQVIALYAPGAQSTRVWLHRMRGVTIGYGVFIGMDALIETSSPELIEIGDRVAIGIRVTIIGHFRGHSRSDTGETPRATMRTAGVRIEDDAFIGPSVTILPNVTIGRGAVVTAGSVVARSVPPLTMVQGNPAKPIAKCGVPLGMGTPIKEFYKHLTPV